MEHVMPVLALWLRPANVLIATPAYNSNSKCSSWDVSIYGRGDVYVDTITALSQRVITLDRPQKVLSKRVPFRTCKAVQLEINNYKIKSNICQTSHFLRSVYGTVSFINAWIQSPFLWDQLFRLCEPLCILTCTHVTQGALQTTALQKAFEFQLFFRETHVLLHNCKGLRWDHAQNNRFSCWIYLDVFEK